MLNPLKLKRLESGLTQFGLSLKAHVPSYYISLQERGYPALKPAQKERIAQVLGVSIGEIFPGEDPRAT